MKAPILALIGAAALLSACTGRRTGDAPDGVSSAGERQAQRHCGECHAIGQDDRSALADAPAFRVLRHKYSRAQLASALGDRIEEIHPRMPVLKMEEDEVKALLEYWQALSPAAS